MMMMFDSLVVDNERDEDDQEIIQEDSWEVITSYFKEKGLVRQQLASFDEFIENTMQEIVDQAPPIGMCVCCCLVRIGFYHTAMLDSMMLMTLAMAMAMW
jgi:DNA-directed RNA polymerase beta subunit